MNLKADAGGAATNATTESIPLGALANGQTYVNVHAGLTAEQHAAEHGLSLILAFIGGRMQPTCGLPRIIEWAARVEHQPRGADAGSEPSDHPLRRSQ